MSGYKLEVLQTDNDNIRREGLAHIHNDMCYPALLTIGQFMDALKSGKYDLHPCRAGYDPDSRWLSGQ